MQIYKVSCASFCVEWGMDRVLQTFVDYREDEINDVNSALFTSFEGDQSSGFGNIKNASEETACIQLMFYKPSKDDQLINHVVAYTTRREIVSGLGDSTFTHFAHVELSFPTDIAGNVFEDGKTMGFSITQTTNVYMRLKLWREEYNCLNIYTTRSKYNKLYNYCHHISTCQIKFDFVGMYSGHFLPDFVLRNRSRETHGTFCSRIILEVMQEFCIGGPKIQALKPWRSTPNDICTSLENPTLGLYCLKDDTCATKTNRISRMTENFI